MCVASISIGLKKIGLEFEGTVEVADRLVEMAARHVSSPPVVLGISIVGSQLDGSIVISNGLSTFIFPVIGIAPIVIRFGVIWL